MRDFRLALVDVLNRFWPLSDLPRSSSVPFSPDVSSALSPNVPARPPARSSFLPSRARRSRLRHDLRHLPYASAAPVQPATQLANYLEQHHLTKGIGDYWSASIVTVVSCDAVVVRPVSTLSGGLEIGRYLSQSSSTWYGGGFQFLVYNGVVPWDDVEGQFAL